MQAHPASSESIGYLLKCTLEVKIQRGGITLPVKEGFRLRSGDRIQAPVKAAVELVHLNVGKQYRILAGQSAMIAPRGVWLNQEKPAQVVRSLRTTRVSPNAGRILALVSRSPGSEKKLSQPQPFGAVESATGLMLRWRNTLDPNQAKLEQLLLVMQREGERKPFLAEVLSGEAVAFPVPTGTLEPGQLYHWEVGLPRPGTGQQKTQSTFWLLEEPERAAVLAARQAAATATRAAPQDPLPYRMLAEQLRAAGLFSQAIVALKESGKRDPDNAATASALAELEGILPL